MIDKPPRNDRDLGAVRGRQQGKNGRGNGSRRRNVAQDSNTSRGSWWVAGVGEIQVDNAMRWERRWGAGVAKRYGNNGGLLMGGW